ncbi:MAG: hypothetical protein GY895_02445 [Phycisphaera sp.]|nr:hypothetical protein [Phycisphaera sp.]
MTIRPLERRNGLAAFALAGLFAIIPACNSAPSTTGEAGSMNASTPESLLASLKSAADASLNDYYAALQSVTDCEQLPEVCRMLSAREAAAREMMALRSTLVKEYGEQGEAASTMMLRGAFLDQFEEIQRATVFTGAGDAAVLRIGTAVYRLRLRDGDWVIVRFPDPPYDPAAIADAIEIVVTRVEAVRKDIVAGRIPSMSELERRLAMALGE